MTHLRINLKTLSVNLGPGSVLMMPAWHRHWRCSITITNYSAPPTDTGQRYYGNCGGVDWSK